MLSRRSIKEHVDEDTTPLDHDTLTFSSFSSGSTEMSNDQKDIKSDRGSMALLLLLYVLQGIPLGLAGSIPLILQSSNVSYKDQAMFSFAFWPFSVKLLWAPVVDALYSRRIGRRKSWLVPVQYLIGLFIIVLSWVSELF